MPKPMIIQSASAPINDGENDIVLTKDQVWAGFQAWARGDKRFVPGFVDVRIVSDDGTEILKDVLQYGKTNMPDGSPNMQKSTFRDDYLVVTEYLAGPWFMALYFLDEDENGEVSFHLTTLRHTRHPDFVDPDARAQKEGAKPPPNVEQNIQRVLKVIREMAASGEI